MTDAILVLNAGSSSIKFSVFVEERAALAPLLRGQIEGLFTTPRFEVKDADGERIGSHAWPEGTRLGHEGALEHLVAFLRGHRGGHELRAVGHRVVHGGQEYSRAGADRQRDRCRAGERWYRSRRCTSPTTWHPSARFWRRAPSCPR